MRNVSSWEAQTQELLSRVEKEIEAVQLEMERHIAALKQRKWALEEAIKAYREMMGTEAQATQQLSPNEITGKSQRELLHLIAQRNEGLLVARYAIKIMKDANVFGDSPNADAAVYSILSRSPEFTRVGRGVYRLDNDKLAETRLKAPKTERGSLVQAVRELREGNPNLTREQVRDTLIGRGFDFGNRNPSHAIHMAWVRLGYYK